MKTKPRKKSTPKRSVKSPTESELLKKEIENLKKRVRELEKPKDDPLQPFKKWPIPDTTPWEDWDNIPSPYHPSRPNPWKEPPPSFPPWEKPYRSPYRNPYWDKPTLFCYSSPYYT